MTAGCTRICHIMYIADDTILSHDRGGLCFRAGDGRFLDLSVFSRGNWTLNILGFLAKVPVNMPSSSGPASDGCAGVTGSDTV